MVRPEAARQLICGARRTGAQPVLRAPAPWVMQPPSALAAAHALMGFPLFGHSVAAGRWKRAPKLIRRSEKHLIHKATWNHQPPATSHQPPATRRAGGVDSPDNIVAVCLHCNSARHRRALPPAPDPYRATVQSRMVKRRWQGGRFFASRSLVSALPTLNRQ